MPFVPRRDQLAKRLLQMPIERADEMPPILFNLLQVDRPSFAHHSDARVTSFLSYWAELASAKGGYPARSDLDPTRMNRNLLNNLFLVDVLKTEKGQHRYRYRLLGSTIVELEVVHRGQYLDEIAGRNIADIEKHYAAALTGSISLRWTRLDRLVMPLLIPSYCVVVLPLADDGKSPTHLFGLCLYDLNGTPGV